MRKGMMRTALVLVCSVVLILATTSNVEAGKWRRAARRAAYYPRVHTSRVYVAAPRVSVAVGPGVSVRAPGVRVNVGTLGYYYPYGSYYYPYGTYYRNYWW